MTPGLVLFRVLRLPRELAADSEIGQLADIRGTEGAPGQNVRAESKRRGEQSTLLVAKAHPHQHSRTNTAMRASKILLRAYYLSIH